MELFRTQPRNYISPATPSIVESVRGGWRWEILGEDSEREEGKGGVYCALARGCARVKTTETEKDLRRDDDVLVLIVIQ